VAGGSFSDRLSLTTAGRCQDCFVANQSEGSLRRKWGRRPRPLADVLVGILAGPGGPARLRGAAPPFHDSWSDLRHPFGRIRKKPQVFRKQRGSPALRSIVRRAAPVTHTARRPLDQRKTPGVRGGVLPTRRSELTRASPPRKLWDWPCCPRPTWTEDHSR